MYGGIEIMYVDNSVQSFNVDGVSIQKSAFNITFSSDLAKSSVNEQTIKLYDALLNSYVDIYVQYSKRIATITPKNTTLVTGRKYTIDVVSGALGVKDILGVLLDEDIIYDIVFSGDMILSIPKIISPVNNSFVDSLSLQLDFQGNDACVVEISNNVDFGVLIINEEILTTAYSPAITMDSSLEYYIRVKGKKQIVNESTLEVKVLYSDYSLPVQVRKPVSSSTTGGSTPPTGTGVSIIRTIPENGDYCVASNTITVFYSDVITGYTIDAQVYKSSTSIEIEDEMIESYVDAGILTEVTPTITNGSKTSIITLPALEYHEYYIVVITGDNGTDAFDKVIRYSTSNRALYIDYDYIKSDVQNFEVDRSYVLDKIQKACDMADYVSLAKIRANNVLYKVKEYVRYKTLLDIVVDYQMGYVSMVGGSIGSFQFQIGNANISSAQDAIKQIQSNIEYWQRTLKGYERPGNALPDYAQRDQANGPSRTNF